MFVLSSLVHCATLQKIKNWTAPRQMPTTTDHKIHRLETQWYRVANKNFAAIYLWLPVLRQIYCDNAALAPNTRTNSCNESSGRSVGIAASYYFNLRNEINKCILWNILHHVINYQHVSIPFAIIGVDLQEHKEYNNLRHGISGTTKSYNKCIKHWVFQPFLITLLMLP
jgi:hypothetical protein